jgi:hypothetical protein
MLEGADDLLVLGLPLDEKQLENEVEPTPRFR